ncbi:hypothetical protein [Amycolatopsis sp. TNS106]|uniref:hypothetical protein n=1 Tax=Amycolatopsis sp. TNS106 TaxID=2861750 RepID=UPI001C5784EF|nr:hypothetical protein [Amycolatopsis sp. TNS106]QXV57678.1 hypothetical protein CVV72_12170 [Amycolatopsis sp. TNS106]
MPEFDDLALVPRHPVTGRSWPHSGAADVVPVAVEVWTWLAFGRDPVTAPVAGACRQASCDDPLPKCPGGRFPPSPDALLQTLARLPAVRKPWLRTIYDRVRAAPSARLAGLAV